MTNTRQGELSDSIPPDRPFSSAHRSAASARSYEIRVQEQLDHKRSEWFEDLELRSSGPEGTVLWGVLADQAALHGVLARIRDLNLTLLSVELVKEDQGEKNEGSER